MEMEELGGRRPIPCRRTMCWEVGVAAVADPSRTPRALGELARQWGRAAEVRDPRQRAVDSRVRRRGSVAWRWRREGAAGTPPRRSRQSTSRARGWRVVG
jgi:hypothetical protein